MKELTIEEIHNIQLNMIKYIDKICKDNNITYTLIYGSLLGAVRHNGFIPWDDDMDIGLFHQDYEKLLELLKNDNTYKLITHDIDEKFYYPFAKLIDPSTTVIEDNTVPIDDYGVYIDIHSFINLPDDFDQSYKVANKLKDLQKEIYYYSAKNIFSYGIGNVFKVMKSKKRGINSILNEFSIVSDRYNNYEQLSVISNWPYYSLDKEIHKTEDIKNVIEHKFEDTSLFICTGYDKYLEDTYGDYMKVPNEINKKIYYKAYKK